MKVSIVIPNWNGYSKLQQHLPEVVSLAKKLNFEEIIVVDDGSTDESVRLLKSEFPEVKLIEKQANSGFSSTVNLGVKSVKSEIVFLLNNDAHPKDDFLDPALKHFENPKIFSVGCNVGGIWAKGYFKDGFFWHSQGEAKTEAEKSKAHNTLWVSGGSGFFRKSIWDNLEGLDTLFDPFYWEDVDLGYRAWKRGYINIWEPQSQVIHYQEPGVISESFSKEKVSETAERNQLLFIWKNITSKKLGVEHKKGLLRMVLEHPKYLKIISLAIPKLPSLLKKRQIERQSAKLTDEEVLEIFEYA
ncbi:MAG: glycosyltransferase family 2 protein [Candidatus Daviesbacteria bacterium]|nr:glycosyltransferase family 2 protein [Candidatus Daviesbacteria bacterium]